MDAGEPDAALQKRPRLASLTPHNHVGPLYHSAGLPPPPHPPPRPHPLSQAPSPPNHYPPNSLPPPTPYPPPCSVASFDASRALPTPSPLTQRPSHGPPVSLPPRSYSQDSAYQTRPPGTPTQLAPADPHRRSITSTEAAHHPPMDHGAPGPQPMWQPVPYGHHPNGMPSQGIGPNGLPNGLPNGGTIPSPQEQYAPQPMTQDQIYPPNAMNQYGQNASYGPAGSQYGAMKRKQVRATQACNNCRSRKQKCDEQRPCSFCKDNSYDCAYKDVPLPKQDRTMREVLDAVSRLSDKVEAMDREMKSRLPKKEAPSSSAVSPEYASPTAPIDRADHYRQSIDNRALSDVTSPASTPAVPGSALDFTRGNTAMGAPIKSERPTEPPTSMTLAAVSDDPLPAMEEPVPGKEDALPADHTTPAHKLLDVWPSMQPFYEHTGVEKSNTNYPLETEERRGLLRVYGTGQGTDLNDGAQAPASPANSGSGEGPDQSPSPREGLWGSGFTAGSPPDYRQLVGPTTPGADWSGKSDIGGMNLDGSLKLDVETVRRLHDSYLHNIDILHPFLDKRRLQKMVEQFAQWYSPDYKAGFSPMYGVPAHVSANERYAGQKRKRSSIPGETSTAPDTAGFNKRRPPPERSIGNAIILLVLALGKVCEYRKVLPGPAGEIRNMDTMRSPALSNATMGSSPQGMDHFYYPHRSHPTHDKNVRNIDILPGLAYYAYASDILGNLHGGNEIAHAQAFLLAGLYMGQYARVLESWSWINTACRVCLILVKKDEKNVPPRAQNKLNSVEAYKINLLKCVYWTCLQLESDIIAEMSTLPPSGISRYQDVVGYPTGVLDQMPPEIEGAETLKMLFYSAQIHLRRILNNAHKELYTAKNQSEESKRGLEWAGHIPNTLEYQLQEWRRTLPQPLQWDDTEPPSTDINEARMRAKYYGARYIIARPFLYIGVHKMDLPPLACEASQNGSPVTPMEIDQKAQNRQLMDLTKSQQRLIEVSKRCVDAAIQSTIAFDRVGINPDIPWRMGDSNHIPERFIVTNIFGTAHAQYGNMLVLAAVYKSRLRTVVGLSKHTVDALLTRTIKFLRRLAPNSPTLKIDAQILENTQKFINGEKRDDSMSSFTGSVKT